MKLNSFESYKCPICRKTLIKINPLHPVAGRIIASNISDNAVLSVKCPNCKQSVFIDFKKEVSKMFSSILSLEI